MGASCGPCVKYQNQFELDDCLICLLINCNARRRSCCFSNKNVLVCAYRSCMHYNHFICIFNIFL